MARRDEERVGYRKSRIDPAMFFARQRESGSGGGDLAALMALLGIGPKFEMEEREQEALEAYRQGRMKTEEAATALAREGLGLKREEAAATAEERKANAEERKANAELRRLQQEEIAERRERGAKSEALQLILASPDVSAEEKRAAIMGANLGKTGEVLAKTEEAKQKGKVKSFREGLETAYKKGPGAVQTFLKTQEAIPGIEEIMRDPSINWRALNEQVPAAGGGFLDKLMGMVRSVVTPPVVSAVQPGEYAPGAGFPRQMAPPATAPPSRRVVAPAVMPERVGYGGGGPPAVAPEWRYGVGELPAEVLPAIPQAPPNPVFLDAIRAWNAAAAGEQERLPWLYGGGRPLAPPPMAPEPIDPRFAEFGY
jgi:hypothetical protein